MPARKKPSPAADDKGQAQNVYERDMVKLGSSKEQSKALDELHGMLRDCSQVHHRRRTHPHPPQRERTAGEESLRRRRRDEASGERRRAAGGGESGRGGRVWRSGSRAIHSENAPVAGRGGGGYRGRT